MKFSILQSFIPIILFTACEQAVPTEPEASEETSQEWNLQSLNDRALSQLDSAQWDKALFAQDIETYKQYGEFFKEYPLNKAPFPVAEYDYAVSSIPFTMEIDGAIFKAIRIGECMDPDCEEIRDRLTLIVQTNDPDSEEMTMVESRNYPYLTAQGLFKLPDNQLDWVFSASPDGYANLMLNMKLFDLRFGETIVIFPQEDLSFFYEQISDSPSAYQSMEEFEGVFRNNFGVRRHL